ncbi:site-specific integrase [Pseudomonas juntendi]|uniref:site-specific integrase n=1 Tax=Pseudomonas juntendi TaxID=2666183 RepID=UPI001F30D036|nr:site-specific integrase [Pseudomonas juntendi]MCO7058248.1 site-specific integrase [Pseudomonas juntendi]UJM11354.1 site-specific integrase [Pseudomonas juntendi]UXA37446.1 site-specific integrase [Pseudomonas juntendi]
MPDNLIQKKGESTWYVRLAIPADVQKALDCKVRVQSLKTGLRKEAMEARLPYLAQWKAEIAAARAQIQHRKENWRVEVALMGRTMKRLTQKKLDALMSGPSAELATAVSEFTTKLERSHVDTALQATETYGLTATEVTEAKELLRTPAAYIGTLNAKAVVAITPARLKRFREFRESRGGAPKHVDQQVSKLERLSEFLKQEALPINFDTVDQWLKSLNRAPKTLSQYLMAGTAFWKWATKYDERWREEYKDKVNPFTGHELPQGGGAETAGQDREMYRRDDALKLHEAALKKKDQPLADLILLGWYTGGRIEELCKLTKDSVISVDGIPCFDFPRSKSKASKRVVPVHPSLLPTINRLIKDSTDTFLIPTSSHDHYGKRSHAISKAFGRLRTAAGFSKLHVFHSFRHTVVTELIRADVPDALAKELVGHETGSVTHDVYSKGASAAQKLEAISKLPTLPT